MAEIVIILTNDVVGYMNTFKAGSAFEVDEPYQVFNDDGTFSICQGMGVTVTVPVDSYKLATCAYFIEHCDDENCSLGTFEYDCPLCNKHGVDYEVFYEDMEIYRGNVVDFDCEHCKNKLAVEYISGMNLVHGKN